MKFTDKESQLFSRLSDEDLERYADENTEHNSFGHAIGKQEAGDVMVMAQELLARRKADKQ